MKNVDDGNMDNSAEALNKLPPKPPEIETLNEVDYLARQSKLAKQAMSGVVSRMTDCVKASTDVSVWISAYPWISVGTMITVGFVTASALTPSRDESFKERIRSLMEEAKVSPIAQATAEKPPENET